MAERFEPETVLAKQGERMIEVKILFWTNDIASGKSMIRPKHAWAGGVVKVERNRAHGIVPQPPRPFHSVMELPAVIEKVLIQQGIVLHRSDRMRKYFHADE